MHILIWWYGVLFSFLRNNEWIALWVEGIALVAIFWWDRKDAKADHEETLEQLKLTSQQIVIGQKQVEASHNAERAWLMTELTWQDEEETEEALIRNWDERSRTKIMLSENTDKQQNTNVFLRLRCRNSGRSPAWVEKIIGYCEIADRPRNVAPHIGHEAQHLGWMEPLGPGVLRVQNISLECPGKLTDNDVLGIFVLVEYRDIFTNRRSTSCGYIAHTHGTFDYLRRQAERPDRNLNT